MEQSQYSFQSITTALPRAAIRLYQVLTLGLAPRCRFYPSCSSYALDALKNRGLVHGLQASLFRLLKCHPWHPGGYDPIH